MPANPHLSLKDLDRLSRVETVFLDPHSEINVTWEQWRELVEAAKAWLQQEAALGKGASDAE